MILSKKSKIINKRNDTEILTLLRGYNENKEPNRPESQAPPLQPQLTSEQFVILFQVFLLFLFRFRLEELMTPFLTPLRDEVTELRSKMAIMESAMDTEKMKIR